MNSFRSFLWNLRTLGPYWWLKCALQNAFTSINECIHRYRKRQNPDD